MERKLFIVEGTKLDETKVRSALNRLSCVDYVNDADQTDFVHKRQYLNLHTKYTTLKWSWILVPSLLFASFVLGKYFA